MRNDALARVEDRSLGAPVQNCGQTGRRHARLARLTSTAFILCCVLGCGGQSNPGGQTISAQIEAAKANPNPQARARALTLLADKQNLAQDTMGARDTFRAAHQAITEISDPSSKAMELGVLAQGYARANDLSAAKNTVAEGRKVAAMIPEPFLQVAAYASMAKALGVAKAPADAADLLRDAEAAAGKFDKTNPLAQQQQVEALITIAEGYQGIDRTASATALFERIGQSIESIDSPRGQADALAAMAAAQARLGLPETAATFQKAIDAAHRIDDPTSQTHALAEIAMKMPDRGKAQALLDEADKLANKISDVGLRSEAQDKIRKARR